MNLLDIIRGLFAQIPELAQPLVVAVAAAIPFVEGEGAVAIGIIGGIHPATAIAAGIVGNVVCVAVLVFASASVRSAVVREPHKPPARSQADKDLDLAVDLALDPAQGLAMDLVAPREDAGERKSRRRAKFQRAFGRYGVAGVSLLGPLLLPTQFTAVMLAASGVRRGRILFWQAVSITVWTIGVALLLTGLLSVVR